MSDLPEVKLKSLVNFPINAVGRTGITATKDAGRIYLDLNYADFQITPTVSVGDMPNSYNLIWNEETETFAKVPFALQATAGVASLGELTGDIVIDGTLETTGQSLGVVGGATLFKTRAAAIASSLPATVTSINILRYATDYPLCRATYIRGTVAGPMAFQDALSNYWELDLTGETVRIPWFGAKGDGVQDDTTAVQAAIDASEGKFLTGRGLDYLFTSTLDGVDDLEIRNCTLVPSTHSAHPCIDFTDKTNWQVRKIWFKGDYPTDLDYNFSWYGAIRFSNSASDALENIAIEDCTFSDFSDSYWIIGSISGSGPIKDFRFCRNRVKTTGIGAGANYQKQAHIFLNLFGSGSSDDGIFINPVIEDNKGDFDDIGIGFALWSRNKGFRVNRNVIRNPGATNTYDGGGGSDLDRNCYGIIIYDVVGDPSDATTAGIEGEIAHNYILNPPSAGIYFAGGEAIDIHDNVVIGQYREDESILPRGGISCNNLRKSIVHHNRLLNCWGGITAVAISGSDTTVISDNYIKGSSETDSFGIRLGAFPGTTTASVIAVRNNRIEMTGATALCIKFQATDSSNYLGPVIIAGNNLTSAYRCISMGGSYIFGTAILKGNAYSGVCSGGALVANSVTGRLVVQGETFDGAAMTGFGLNVGSSVVTLADNLFVGKAASAECITAVGATGTIEGMKFRGVSGSLRVAASSLGTTAPSHSGTAGDFVQDLSSGAYTPSSSSLNRGWMCQATTTWNACKTAT